MKALLILILSCIPNLSWAQKLPNDIACQDLLDIDSGKLSRDREEFSKTNWSKSGRGYPSPKH